MSHYVFEELLSPVLMLRENSETRLEPLEKPIILGKVENNREEGKSNKGWIDSIKEPWT